MSDADVIEKFLDLVADRLTPLDARRIATTALEATNVTDVRELVAELTRNPVLKT
jgi:hypothetical protein